MQNLLKTVKIFSPNKRFIVLFTYGLHLQNTIFFPMHTSVVNCGTLPVYGRYYMNEPILCTSGHFLTKSQLMWTLQTVFYLRRRSYKPCLFYKWPVTRWKLTYQVHNICTMTKWWWTYDTYSTVAPLFFILS